jgi:hypothetical protein
VGPQSLDFDEARRGGFYTQSQGNKVLQRASSGASSGPGSVCADAGDAPTIGSMSMNRLRHPALWRFTGVSVDGGGFDGFSARTFATKSESYRAHC